MNETMLKIAMIFVSYYVAQFALAFWLFLRDQRQFKKGLGWPLTNGDVVFCVFMSANPVGWLVALSIAAINGFGPKSAAWANRRSPLDR